MHLKIRTKSGFDDLL